MVESRKLADTSVYIARGVSPAYDEQGVTVFNQKCIRNNTLSTSEARITNPEKKRISPEKYVRRHDVLVNSTGVGTLGRIAQLKSELDAATVDSHVTIVRPNLSVVDGSYFGYAMVYREPLIASMGEGATGQTELSRTRLGEEIEIPVPPLSTQGKIASVLSAYDDLIENNTRRIEILEEIAQRIYREWFVHFRFPGHEKVRMVESELGLIPEGWELRAVKDLLDYQIGGGWGKEEQSEEYPDAAYVIRGTDIPSARHTTVNNCPLRFHKHSNLASRRLQPEDIVFEVSGGSKDQPVGRALSVGKHLLRAFDEDVMCASFCKLLRPKQSRLLSPLLYLHLLEIYESKRIEKYQVQSTGISNFKFQFFLESELIVVPTTEVQTAFRELVAPLFEAVWVLGVRNTNLRCTRDLLLPKLISGEVDVEHLDIEFQNETYE